MPLSPSVRSLRALLVLTLFLAFCTIGHTAGRGPRQRLGSIVHERARNQPPSAVQRSLEPPSDPRAYAHRWGGDWETSTPPNAGQWTTLNRAEEAHGLSFSSLVPSGWEISRVGFPLRRHLDLRSHESPQSTVPLKKVFRLAFVVEGVGYRWCEIRSEECARGRLFRGLPAPPEASSAADPRAAAFCE
jgi:hypothetical protein